MSQQNYASHRRWVPLYHFVLPPVLLAVLIGSLVNLVHAAGTPALYSASLILVIALALFPIFFYLRAFALKAQDRAIRAEENFRHFVLAGKPLDPRLNVRQIIGLRFAGDDEFVKLAALAAEKNLSEDEIKKSIQNWRADTYRV